MDSAQETSTTRYHARTRYLRCSYRRQVALAKTYSHFGGSGCRTTRRAIFLSVRCARSSVPRCHCPITAAPWSVHSPLSHAQVGCPFHVTVLRCGCLTSRSQCRQVPLDSRHSCSFLAAVLLVPGLAGRDAHPVTVTEVEALADCRGLPESVTRSTNVFVPALFPQECGPPLLAAPPSTVAEYGAVPPLIAQLSVTLPPVVQLLALLVRLARSAGGRAVTATEVESLADCRGLPESVTATVNALLPALFPQECELPLLAAPPLTVAEYGAVPPLIVQLSVTLPPVWQLLALLVRLTRSAGGGGGGGGGGAAGAVTVTDVRTVFACRGLPESPTTSTNVFVPALLPQECELPLLAALPSTAAE